MRTRVRRCLAGGAAVAALVAGMSITGASSAQAEASGCCSFQSHYSYDDALQQLHYFESHNHVTCTNVQTTLWPDPVLGDIYVAYGDCPWPSA